MTVRTHTRIPISSEEDLVPGYRTREVTNFSLWISFLRYSTVLPMMCGAR